jgi:hypothetical protein
MTSEQDDPPGGADASPRRRRPPTPTIDLTAEEVARATPEGSSMPGENSAAEPSDPQAEDTNAADEPPMEPPGALSEPQAPGGFAWSLLAGAVGGGIVLFIFTLVWLAGGFSPRDDRSNALAALNALNGRVAAVESRLGEISKAPASATIDQKTIADISSRLAKLEAAPAVSAAPANEPGLAKRLAAVEDAAKAFQGQVADLNRRIDDNAAAVREARGRADAAISAADAAPAAEHSDVEALTTRIAALERATKAFTDDLAKRPAAVSDRPLRLAVAAQALQAAVERGDPFAAELAAVKPLAANPQALIPLEPFAASGVPTVAALTRQLTELVPAMRRLTAAPPPQGGFLDRLQANAERLVRIRPIDETPGDDPAAIISRIEAKAVRSDVAGALAELAKLPAPLRAPAEEWITKAKAREAAVDASRRVAADALATLGKPQP